MNLRFKKNGIVHEPIKHWELMDGNILAIYQGSRGGNPDLDFIVKYKKPNSKLRAPSHTHWIVDLIIKSEHSPEDVKGFISEWIELYDRIEPFSSQEQRNNYNFLYYEYFNEKYFGMDNLGAFSVEFLSCMLELFTKCEKQTEGAFMFKNLLTLVKDYCEGKKDYYQIISYSKRV
ncbi:MAG: hypothetical protein RLZ10_2302 [Bacteroidota bacterium]|jgi:hypothetical protein